MLSARNVSEHPCRELMLESIQLTARRWTAAGVAPELLDSKTDAELLTWLRRLAALEFRQHWMDE